MTNLAVALVTCLLILFLVPRLLVFFAPFVAGWIVAWIAGPLVRFFETKLKIRRKAGSAVVIVLVIALVIGLIYLLGSKLVKEGVGLIGALPEIWTSTQRDLNEIGRKLEGVYTRLPGNLQIRFSDVGRDVTAYLGNWAGNISVPTIEAVGNFAKQLPALLIGIIMALLSSYLFVAEHDQIAAWLAKVMPESIQNGYRIVRRSLVRAVGGYFKAQLKIEVWMYLLLVIGLSVLHIDYALLIALGIAVLDFIPLFGTGTVLVPWAMIKLLSSDYQLAIGLLIIWGAGQLVRQLIQPRIVGNSVGIAPIPTIFLLYIGYRLGSVIGMIIAVPVGLILFGMYEEGVFDTTFDSVRILVNGVNRFRRLDAEDLEGIRKGSQPGKCDTKSEGHFNR